MIIHYLCMQKMFNIHYFNYQDYEETIYHGMCLQPDTARKLRK